MVDCIEDAAIPVCMVGLLSALPNTQLTRRLQRACLPKATTSTEGGGDQCVQGLNFETLRPRREIFDDYRQVLERIYDPAVYCGRVERLIGRLKWTGKLQQEYAPDHFRRRHGIKWVGRIVSQFPEWRDLLWTTFMRCYQTNPAAVRQTVTLLALFLHLGPYARQAIAETKRAVAEIDGESTHIRRAFQHSRNRSHRRPTRQERRTRALQLAEFRSRRARELAPTRTAALYS